MRVSFRIKKYSFLLMGLILIGASVVFANDEMFQNNLLKIDVLKTPQGGVKVTLYTKKPYNDSVMVNKKSDTEYVILMPETSNSLTAKPALKSASDVVQNVEVKTQQYSPDSRQKGYTKIVFSTLKPIEITPTVKTVNNPDFLSENEYKELMEQVGKKQSTKSKKQRVKAVAKPVAKTATTNRVVSAEKTAVKLAYSTKKQPVKKQTVKEQPIKEQAVNEKTATAPIAAVQKAEKVEKVVAENPPIENKPAPNKITQGETPEQAASTPQAEPTGRLHKYKRIIKNLIKNNLYFALGLIFIPLFIILLILRGIGKAIKKNRQQKEAFSAHLDEKPTPAVDYTEKINEDMSWKEKFQTYVDTQASSEAEAEAEEKAFQNAELDNLFIGEEEVGEAEEISAIDALNEIEELAAEQPQSEHYGEELSVDEIFGDEDELFECEDEIEVGEEIIQSQFSIDAEKSFYLVEYEGHATLAGQIGEEIFILKQFEEPVKGSIQARLSEKKGSTSTYIVKAEGFKALIEVKSDNMKLLIEL